MTIYICNNERYTPEAISFASIEEFEAYCAAIFGVGDDMPRLNEQLGNGIVVDETGETVLTMKEPIVLTPEMLIDLADEDPKAVCAYLNTVFAHYGVTGDVCFVDVRRGYMETVCGETTELGDLADIEADCAEDLARRDIEDGCWAHLAA